MLRVSGETIEGPRPADLFDVLVDEAGDLVLVLLDVQAPAESPGFLGSMMRHARAALETHEPLHQVVNELEMQLAMRPGIEAGLVILRLSQRDARVEILNAGMPPVANAPPGGKLSVHPALSGPVGRRVGEVHPYELVPLIWGSTWLAVSDGMTGGSIDTTSVSELCTRLEFAERGMALAAASRDVLYDALQEVLPAARFLRDDATCIIIGADVHGDGDAGKGGRFQSGIESR
jgi:hypothetical protein